MEATSAAPWGEHDTLICRLDADGILEVRLNRPEQLNAFTPRMCAELMAVFTRVNRDDAVRAVLLSPAWTGCRSAAERAEHGPNLIRDDFYWAWLVLTHHPLRLEEACQLMVRNIVRKEGIWCLHIAEDEQGNQQLKTENATRLVPIHRLLLEAGFLSRVEQLRREGVRALFPSFQPTTASRAKQLTESVSIDIRQR